MLICFILFRTQLPVTERFHITEIRLKIRFHNNKCILICNCAVFQIFQHLIISFRRRYLYLFFIQLYVSHFLIFYFFLCFNKKLLYEKSTSKISSFNVLLLTISE